MKKQLLTLLLCLPLLGMAQKTYVPDISFESSLEYIGAGDGIANNDSALTISMQTLTELLYLNSIADFTGIEECIALEKFKFINTSNLNNPTLDLTNSTQLKVLELSGIPSSMVVIVNPIPLERLKLSSFSSSIGFNLNDFINLKSLTISNSSSFNTINISSLIQLDSLQIFNSNLTTIDITNNTQLKYLNLSYNALTSINLAGNLLLNNVNLFSNDLTAIDVSNNATELEILDVGKNLIAGVLDVTGATVLRKLVSRFNPNTGINISGLNEFRTLEFGFDSVASLDVSTNPELRNIDCKEGKIEALDFSNNPNMFNLLVTYCQNFSALNLQNGYWGGYIDISNNPNLFCTEVDSNRLYFNNGNFSLYDDNHNTYAFDCNYSTAIGEVYSTDKTLLKITDVLGRNAKGTKNIPLFYIYNDGTVEKKIIIE